MIDNAPIMDVINVPNSKLASVYVVIGDVRYNLMNLVEFKCETELHTKDYNVLGSVETQRRVTGQTTTFTATAHINTSIWNDMVKAYNETGVLPRFNIITRQNDPSTKIGTQTIVYKNCLIDKLTIASISVEADEVTQEISGSVGKLEFVKSYNNMDGVL